MFLSQKLWKKEGRWSFRFSFLELGVTGLWMSVYFLPKNRLIRGKREKTELKHDSVLITEKRTKETRCEPAKRLEITAQLPFNFVLVLKQLLASAFKSNRAKCQR